RSYYVTEGLEIGIDGWMQNCPYSQFTMEDVKMIERTLRTMDVYTVDVLRLFFKPASKGLKEGLEKDFGKFTSLIHLTPTAKRITNQFLPIKKPFANPNDHTEIREVISEICRINKT